MIEDNLYRKITDLGSFFPLSTYFELSNDLCEIDKYKEFWRPYNKNKKNNRWGMSLFSLKGETDGEIDLNSVLEYNKLNNTSYDEMSFRTPTEIWKGIPEISNKLSFLATHLGRSHFLRLDAGGFFPPHRDYGKSFRLISFFSDDRGSLCLLLDGEKKNWTKNKLYFLDSRKEHSLFSFSDNSTVLVLNVEINEDTVKWVYENLEAK
jgi:hypothetical protein